MSIVFSSGITNLVERNKSFDSGVLRVAYVGKNRNNSFISKETFERCMPSIYNCPVVCRYDRDTDMIGSHDVELVTSADGGMYLANITHPVGVVPESARTWWEEIEDESGIHEYLCTDVILWKRQEAYRKIEADGIVDESMEITVKSGGMVDGVYHISDFEFTAFCLLGSAEPCYESASVQLFSHDSFKQELAEMMREFKEEFSKEQPSTEVVHTQISMEGGEKALDEKIALLAELGISQESLDFNLEDVTVEELRKKFEVVEDQTEEEPVQEPEEEPVEGSEEDGGAEDEESEEEDPVDEPAEEPEDEVVEERFTLSSEFEMELLDALHQITVETCFGEMFKYYYVNYDYELSEVYCHDVEDWKLYGFKYSMNGDRVIIDFESKKRKKYEIVDFDEGDETAAFEDVFKDLSQKYQALSDEVESLRDFKAETENAKVEEQRMEVLDRFESLSGVEAFDKLKEDHKEYSVEELEEKCYAIRGRQTSIEKFSLSGGAPKIKVEQADVPAETELYGGLFQKYGFR